jgi:ribonuclease P protein component
VVVSYCFPKRRRLRKRGEFLAVQRAGTRRHSRYFVVVSVPGGSGRLGITVSKKVGNAVIRNRVKRLVREFVRTARSGTSHPWQGAPWLPESRDVVVIARHGAGEAPTRDLWADLDTHRASLATEGARC